MAANITRKTTINPMDMSFLVVSILIFIYISLVSTMTIQEFIQQAHCETLDWIEDNLIEKLIMVDQHYKAGTIRKQRLTGKQTFACKAISVS